MAKPTVPEVLPIARRYFAKEGNAAGGSLHIVLEDGNIDDSSVQFCREWALERGDADGVALADLLLRMSKTQRKKIASSHLWPTCDVCYEPMNIHDGYLCKRCGS